MPKPYDPRSQVLPALAGLALTLTTGGCASEARCGQDALSTCLAPQQAPTYYVEQGLKYFDTLDSSADRTSHPEYGELVARWEWPPWLKLTGYGEALTVAVDEAVLTLYPTTLVPVRDCRAFAVQPFARCRVSFDYDGRACPIYEEFTFNDQGQVTFIEAWTDAPGLLPMDPTLDPWAEGDDVHRLSTKVPGLGNATGTIDPEGEAMTRAALADAELADFAERAQDFWIAWFDELEAVGGGENAIAHGCGWTP